MRIVIDGLAIQAASLGIFTESALHGWVEAFPDDELHLVVGPGSSVEAPAGVQVHDLPLGSPRALHRLLAQNRTLPKLCRSLGADAMLAITPATTMTPLPCPRVVIVHDMRHELRPDQFSRAQRLLRTSYVVGLRQADAVIAVSERTRGDVLAPRPWLSPDRVHTVLEGSDHVLRWAPAARRDAEFAVAFGQYGNKNVGLVLDAWAVLRDRGQAIPLELYGIPGSERAAVEAQIDRLDLRALVTPSHWVTDDVFRARFSASSLVVFPSDFEGFGIPAGEAMRLRIPLVISPDPALLEVAGDGATVMAGWTVGHLVDAVVRARATTDEQLDRAEAIADGLRWSTFAAGTRAVLERARTAARNG